jgi:Nucleotidyl transferase AbiEii toxin, Type IV TA system
VQFGNTPVADKPRNLDPLADRVLISLAARPEAAEIVLGGYFALQHYADYRSTHDIDAWWRTQPSATTEADIRAVMEEIATSEGYELGERRFGETISLEMHHDGKKLFSFQIAVRSVELEPPGPSAWPPILLETIHDNIGAKMNALVGRGAARDFLDIAHLVQAKFTTPAECWTLWSRKNPGGSLDAAKSKVAFHLMTMKSRRPLDSIQNPVERANAQQTREWFRLEFLGMGP